MMRTIALGMVGALALAGCNDAGDGSNTVAAPASNEAALNYQTEVAALSPDQREAVFIRAIRDAGLDCQGVESAEESAPGSFVWAVRCEDGSKHQISIAASGDAKVTSAVPPRR